MKDDCRSRAGRGWWLAVLVGYVVSRILARAVFGVTFDDNPLLWFWQYLDPELLRNDVLASLWVQHAQPPLYNLYLSSVLKTCGGASTGCFETTYFGFGLALHLGLFALILRLGVDRRVALGATLLFAFAPASILYEHWLFYTYPMTALLVGSGVFIHRAVAGGGRTRDTAIACTLLAAAVLTRSLFHLVWLAGALTLIAWPLRRQWRRLVAVAALPVMLCVAVYAKNAVVFGEFSTSSWLGMSLARLSIEPIPPGERRALVSNGTIGRVSLVKPFSPVDDYPPGLVRDAPTGHPALDATHKTTSAPNYNHGAYLAIGRAYRRDARALLFERPEVYRASVARAWTKFSMAPSIILFLRTNRERMGGWADAYMKALYGFELVPVREGAPPTRPELRYVMRGWGALYLLLAAGSVFVASLRGLREWLRPGGDAALGALLLFASGTVAYVAIVGNALELGENNRFRFMIEPLLFALIAWLLGGSMQRRSRKPGVDDESMQTSVFEESRTTTQARTLSTVWLAALTIALGAGTACSPASSPPNVVLVVLDTTRADALSAYGNPRNTTPHIDALAHEGVRFERAYSTDFWTLPSHASLLTGLHPSDHGATSETNHLPSGVPTVAEQLSRAGYRTAGFVSNPWVSRERGFARGFDVYREGWHQEPTAPTAYAMDRAGLDAALAWIDRDGSSESAPFFLFINWNSAHLPYEPDPLLYVELYPEPVDVDQTAMLKRIKGGWGMVGGGFALDSDDLSLLRGLYDAEVARLDQLVGRLVDGLATRGLLDGTLIVITSDHGEAFGEHGTIDHLPGMYDTTVRVPLIVRYPERFSAGQVRLDLTSLVDVAPTLLDVAGVLDGMQSTTDRSLANGARTPRRFVVAENERPINGIDLLRRGFPELDTTYLDHRLRMLRTDTHKLIWKDGRGVELYDLETDPGEQRDLAVTDPQTRDHLTALLVQWMSDHIAASTAPAEPFESRDARANEQLRALGYIE